MILTGLWVWFRLLRHRPGDACDLLKRLGIPRIEKKISARTAYAIGAACEGIYTILRKQDEPPMTRFVAVELSKDHFFDISAARRDLGYNPAVATETGLEELVAHWRSK